MTDQIRILTVRDLRPKQRILAFDVIDILRLLEPELEQTQWEVSGLECTGEASERLYAIEASRERVSGSVLREVTSKIRQVIDGKFVGHKGTAGPPWVTILAWDSSGFDVLTADQAVLDRVRGRFKDVSEVPADQYKRC